MKKFTWWHGSDLAEFFARGHAMAGQDFRVEFHPKEEKGLKIVPLDAVIEHA